MQTTSLISWFLKIQYNINYFWATWSWIDEMKWIDHLELRNWPLWRQPDLYPGEWFDVIFLNLNVEIHHFWLTCCLKESYLLS